MKTSAMLLIILGLFLAGGVFSFLKQKMPIAIIVLLGLCSAVSLAAGVMRA